MRARECAYSPSPGQFQRMEDAIRNAQGKEVCGLLYTGDRYVPLRNIATAGRTFSADPADLARALSMYGEPAAVFHSHPSGILQLSGRDETLSYYHRSIMIVGAVVKGRLRYRAYRILP